jgi:hypothetical protein
VDWLAESEALTDVDPLVDDDNDWLAEADWEPLTEAVDWLADAD